MHIQSCYIAVNIRLIEDFTVGGGGGGGAFILVDNASKFAKGEI